MENGNGSSALAVVENSLDANVGVLMRRATDVAGVCREIVMKTAQTIQGRKYVRVEGWQAIAVAYGCVASARDITEVYDPTGKLRGVRAIGEVRRMSDGVVVSTAEGFVGVDEPTWFGGESNGKRLPARPMYAIRAMAQTRSESRACRGAFSFVVTLIDSNLATTPAEEMEGVQRGSETPPAPNVTKPVPAMSSRMEGLKAALADAQANNPPSHTDADFRPDATSPSQHTAPEQPTHNRNASFGFGRDKGVIVAELSEQSLQWYVNCFRRDLADPSKSNFHARTAGQLADAEGELKYRGL